MAGLILCTTSTGWSLHAPGSSDEDIASGVAAPLASGDGRPEALDYEHAQIALAHPDILIERCSDVAAWAANWRDGRPGIAQGPTPERAVELLTASRGGPSLAAVADALRDAGCEVIHAADIPCDTVIEVGSRPGRTIREAILIALEGIAGRTTEWLGDDGQHAALRNHVLGWVHSYAEHRGVILADSDVAGELDAVISELRAGR
jgi:hypothetical protein